METERLIIFIPLFDIYFGFENFLPPVFTVWHDALDCKKNAPNKTFSRLEKIDLFIYLFILHFCKTVQQKLQYIPKARQNEEQKIMKL